MKINKATICDQKKTNLDLINNLKTRFSIFFRNADQSETIHVAYSMITLACHVKHFLYFIGCLLVGTCQTGF